jgi:hypothetical protein
MSHIDEGALHAYLDGALDSCDECALRLEEERAIREEAESILAPSAPVVQMPPLEELRVAAKRRTEASRVRGMSRVTRWGWAASVVLALGSGWMLRGAIPGMISRPTQPQPLMESGVGAPAVEGTSGDVFGSEEDLEQDARGAGEATSSVTGDESEGAGPAETLGFADEDAVADPPEEQVGGRDAPADDPAEASPPPSSVQQAPPARTQERAGLADSVAERGGRVGVDTVPRTEEAEEPVVARREAPAAEAPREPTPALEGRSRGAMQVRAAFDRQDDFTTAKSMLGLDEAGSLVVPDLQVIDITRVQDAPVDDVVLVRQLMENGDTLEILHLPPGSDPEALAPAPTDGRTRLVAARGEGWIILRADAGGDELETYLRRLLSG